MSFVNFEEVKARVSLEQAAQMLKLNLKKGNGTQFRCPCPACPNAGERALVITPGKGWYCWGKRAGGDVIALAAHVLDVNAKEAAAFLAGDQEHSAPTVPESESGKAGKTLQPLSYLDPDNEAVAAIGFDAGFAKKHGIGYASKGLMRGTVAIPFRDETGTLLGYVGATDLVLPPDFTANVVSFPKKTA